MSCKNTSKKTSTNSVGGKFSLNSISGVLNLILTAFYIPDEPIAPLPPQLIFTGGKLRPGLSSEAIAARIIARQSESGRQVGQVFADGINVEETMELIRIEEIINALQTEAVVNVAIDPGIAVNVVGVGNMGAPVVSQGTTVNVGVGNGIIR